MNNTAAYRDVAKSVFSYLDPDVSNPHVSYEGKPVQYAREVLGERLTPQQEVAAVEMAHGSWTVLQSSTAVGKSYLMAIMAFYFFDVYADRGVKIYCLAAPPLENLSDILWANIQRIAEKHPTFDKRELKKLRIIVGKNHIKGVSIPSQGGEANIVSRTSGKHAPVLIFFIDEADGVPDAIYKGIDGCTSGGRIRVISSFNPKKRYGAVYKSIQSGKAKVIRLCSFDHPNVVEGRDVFPGAVTRDYVIDKTNEWTVAIPHHQVTWKDNEPPFGVFKLPDFLVGERSNTEYGRKHQPLKAGWRRVVEPEYSYKVLGDYPPDGERQLMSQAHIEAAVLRHGLSDYSKFAALPLRAGFDVADEGGDGCSLMFIRGTHYMQKIVRWTHTDVNDGTDTALEHLVAEGAMEVFVDGVGMGKSYADTLRRKVEEKRLGIRVILVNVAKPESSKFRTRRDRLYWRMSEWIKNDVTHILDDEDLLRQLQIVDWHEGEKGRIIVTSKAAMRSRLGKSPDAMESLLMTMDSAGVGYFSI